MDDKKVMNIDSNDVIQNLTAQISQLSYTLAVKDAQIAMLNKQLQEQSPKKP